MKAWTFFLGGLVVWTLHFAGVYAIASVADVAGDAASPASRLTVAAFTVVCLAANGALLAWAARGPAFLRREDGELAGFWRAVGALGAAISAIAVLWQGLPTLVGH